MSEKAQFMLINEHFERVFNDVFLNVVVMLKPRCVYLHKLYC